MSNKFEIHKISNGYLLNIEDTETVINNRTVYCEDVDTVLELIRREIE